MMPDADQVYTVVLELEAATLYVGRSHKNSKHSESVFFNYSIKTH